MILHADARYLPLADGSVHCVVTSPPYWGLRDYGLPAMVWGGPYGSDCGHHEWGDPGISGQRNRNGQGGNLEGGDGPEMLHPATGATCLRCGAWRGTLGLEPTPTLYVEHMVQVFREVWRVLRDDGTLWCNLGDAFLNKQLLGLPWRVAFALQQDGWYLRSDIIWSKPNPMPESVTDRPTKAHEYLFLLAKSERYYYDAEAIKEDVAGTAHKRQRLDGSPPSLAFKMQPPGNRNRNNPIFQSYMKDLDPELGRNRRSVWTIATQLYPEAHFATFPEDLVKPCVLAGCPVGDTVLDPFAGSGTVVKVAQDLGRRGIGVELSPAYVALGYTRSAQLGIML